jgi:hypothetical protein
MDIKSIVLILAAIFLAEVVAFFILIFFNGTRTNNVE